MAYGKNQSTGELIIFKPVTKDKATQQRVNPYFQEVRKIDGKYSATDNKDVTFVSGKLSNIKVDTETFKQPTGKEKKYEKISIYLSDNERSELYLIDLRFNIAVRGLLNSVLNLQSFDDVKISLYEKDGYLRYSVYENGEWVKGLYKKEDVPEPRIFEGKDGEEKDYAPIDSFYKEKINAFGELLKTTRPSLEGEETEIPRQEQEEDEVGF